MNMREAFEEWWNGRGLPEGLKPAFYMVWQAALAAQAQQESRIVYLWRQRNHDDDNAWIDGSKELHGWMSKDKKYETRVLYEKPASKGDKE